jgi:hypothetical protein
VQLIWVSSSYHWSRLSFLLIMFCVLLLHLCRSFVSNVCRLNVS